MPSVGYRSFGPGFSKVQDLDCTMQSKLFGFRFELILMIQTVHILYSFVKISTLKNHVDRTQFNNRSILFYNLINECFTQNYTHLSWSTINMYPIKVIFYIIRVLDEVYNMTVWIIKIGPKRIQNAWSKNGLQRSLVPKFYPTAHFHDKRCQLQVPHALCCFPLRQNDRLQRQEGHQNSVKRVPMPDILIIHSCKRRRSSSHMERELERPPHLIPL